MLQIGRDWVDAATCRVIERLEGASTIHAPARPFLRGMLAMICAALFPLAASARNAEGLLDVIQTPNNGVPAVLEKGGVFEAVLTKRGELRLDAPDRSIPLTCEWADESSGLFRARCSVPPDLPAGTYSLHWQGEGAKDANTRAVFVWDAFPEYYVIAHVTDTHLGKHVGSEDMNRRVFQAVNESEAAFAAVTGDLSEGGEIEQFQAVLRVLDTCRIPTFVCPGNHDRQATNYAKFFGPLCYSFRFGKDGYIVYDTKDFVTASELGPQDGTLQMYRRSIKDARWAVGLTHRYEPMQGMRSQLVLFIDDPLDYLLWGHRHRENPEDEKTVPWGMTPIRITPAAINGRLRFVDVTEQGLRPRPFVELEPAQNAKEAPAQ